MIKSYYFKNLFSSIKTTPFHPQWFLFKNKNRNLHEISDLLNGNILDVGCGDKLIKNYLSDNCYYIGLDYYKTSTEWYNSTPEVYGDAQSLSFPEKSIDCVLLLDVMEHLPEPDRCLNEVGRVLEESGSLIISVPFLYPIHDAPLDYRRWTLFGLREVLAKHGFSIKEEKSMGNPLESAGTLINIAMSKTVLNWIYKKKLMALLIIFLPFIILIINTTAWLLTMFSSSDDMMPLGYRIIAEKK